MQTKILEISKQIAKEDAFRILDSKYSVLGPIWVYHQLEWCNGVYAAFKDHDKFLIIIFLTKKTLENYSNNLIKLSYDEFFSNNTIEIEKFNLTEISSKLNIPKESARRKVMELENDGVIKRINKKIIIDRSCFNFSKPINSIKRVSIFLATLLTICKNERIIPQKVSSEELQLVIKDNFTNIWNLYYEVQIPMMINYKKIFKDYDTLHIYGACAANQHLDAKRLFKAPTDREHFIKSLFTNKKRQGINAMSISEITGIPRATVIRKLKKLIKIRFLSIDKKKHYRLKGNFVSTLKPKQKDTLYRLANFSAKVYNILILN